MKKHTVFLLLFLILSGCSSTYETKEESMISSTKNQSKTTQTNIPNVQQETDKNKNKMKDKVLLDVPLIKQNPELKYGCEITSVTMLLQYAGVNVNKMQLYKEVEKDTDKIKKAANGDILNWGDPNEGFVGDMTGRSSGYAVFDKPIVDLVEKYLPNRSVNLTGYSFQETLQQVNDGKPVVVWTTGDYLQPNRWEEWEHNNKTIKTPLDLHAVVLVGYDDKNVYVNDPLSGKKQHQVSKNTFIKSWQALKKRSVSYN